MVRVARGPLGRLGYDSRVGQMAADPVAKALSQVVQRRRRDRSARGVAGEEGRGTCPPRVTPGGAVTRPLACQNN